MQPPDEPRGSGYLENWLKKLLAFTRSCQLVEGIGYRLNRSHRGTSLEILPGKGGTTGLNFRGEYNAGETYNANDVVIYGSSLNLSVLSDGKKAGTYIATRTITPADNEEPGEPNSGGWSTFARFATPTFAVAAATSNTPKILMVADLESPRQVFTASNTTGRITIDLAHANGKAISIREIGVCVNGVNKKMLVLGSEIY